MHGRDILRKIPAYQNSTIYNGFAVCILTFAPFIDIELPLGSSRSKLQFWAMGFWLLIQSGALTKTRASRTTGAKGIKFLQEVASFR